MSDFSLFATLLFAQSAITGKVTDGSIYVSINGCTVLLSPGNVADITDESGRFYFRKVASTIKRVTVIAIGNQQKSILISGFKSRQTYPTQSTPDPTYDMVITTDAANLYKAISKADIKMCDVSNSQEVLRIVPGLFIGQYTLY